MEIIIKIKVKSTACLILVLFVIMIFLTACENKQHTTTDSEDYSVEIGSGENTQLIDITSILDKYRLTMSSVPGLPIEIKNLDPSNTYFIAFEGTNGEVVMWHEGQVSAPVTDYTMLKDQAFMVYWRPTVIHESTDQTYDLNVIVYGNDLSVELDRYTRVISIDEDLYFYLKSESD